MAERHETPDEAIREAHRKELAEAEGEGKFSWGQLDASLDRAYRDVSDEVLVSRLLTPSSESLLLIEKNAGDLSERQREFLRSQTYFVERLVEVMTQVANHERAPASVAEDIERVGAELSFLLKRYETTLEPGEEFSSAREAVDQLLDYLRSLYQRGDAQPLSLVYANVVNRLFALHSALAPEDGSHEQTAQYHTAGRMLYQMALQRIPERVEESVQRKGENAYAIPISAERALPSPSPDDLAQDLARYLKENYRTEGFTIPLPKEEMLSLREELDSIVEEKGHVSQSHRGRGKVLRLRGPEVEKVFGGKEVEVWVPGEELPVHITVRSLRESTPRPDYVGLAPDGSLFSVNETLLDVPETTQWAERRKNLSPEEWKRFVQNVIEQARKLEGEPT